VLQKKRKYLCPLIQGTLAWKRNEEASSKALITNVLNKINEV